MRKSKTLSVHFPQRMNPNDFVFRPSVQETSQCGCQFAVTFTEQILAFHSMKLNSFLLVPTFGQN